MKKFYLYFADTKSWYVGDFEDMRRGIGAGYLMSESDARDPKKIEPDSWWVGEEGGKWKKAPDVSVVSPGWFWFWCLHFLFLTAGSL